MLQVLELGWRPEIPEHLPEGYKSFVRQCWEEDREKVRSGSTPLHAHHSLRSGNACASSIAETDPSQYRALTKLCKRIPT